MAKHTDDYIPTFADIEHERNACKQRIEGKADPRKHYECTYEVNGAKMTEIVMALDTKSAIEHIKQQLGMVGWVPANLNVTVLENTK